MIPSIVSRNRRWRDLQWRLRRYFLRWPWFFDWPAWWYPWGDLLRWYLDWVAGRNFRTTVA
jgi:hypothetical protein